MPYTQNTALIVSSSEQFDVVVRQHLKGFLMTDIRRSAALARRSILERSYDLVIINAPLPDESGEQLALDAAEHRHTSVLLVIPSEVYEDVLEHVTDHGIYVLSKPLVRGRLSHAIRYLMAVQERIRSLELKIRKTEDRMEEIRVVDRAKLLLMEKEHMSEEEAHRYIGKEAMNNGVTRRVIAERIVEDL